jgi:hypothetical protein
MAGELRSVTEDGWRVMLDRRICLPGCAVRLAVLLEACEPVQHERPSNRNIEARARLPAPLRQSTTRPSAAFPASRRRHGRSSAHRRDAAAVLPRASASETHGSRGTARHAPTASHVWSSVPRLAPCIGHGRGHRCRGRRRGTPGQTPRPRQRAPRTGPGLGGRVAAPQLPPPTGTGSPVANDRPAGPARTGRTSGCQSSTWLTVPTPTVRLPSRMANSCPVVMATG